MAPDPEQNNSYQDPHEQLVVGSSKLFNGDKLRFIPMPTPDPKGEVIPKTRVLTAVRWYEHATH